MVMKLTAVKQYFNTVTSVMDEHGNYLTRGQLIKEMQDNGTPQRCIDMYLFGLDRNN